MGVVEWHGDRIADDVARAARAALDRAGKQIAQKARTDLSKPFPPASSRGQAPRRRTGRLAAAQEHTVVVEGGEMVMTVGTAPGLRYGPPVVSERAWLAITSSEDLVIDTVTDEVRSALR